MTERHFRQSKEFIGNCEEKGFWIHESVEIFCRPALEKDVEFIAPHFPHFKSKRDPSKGSFLGPSNYILLINSRLIISSNY